MKYNKKEISKKKRELRESNIYIPRLSVTGKYHIPGRYKKIEEWRTVKYIGIKDDYYEVSNYGRVRRIYNNELIKISEDEMLYHYVQLQGTEKRRTRNTFKSVRVAVHRIVAYTFLEIPDGHENMHVNHMNTKTWDNSVYNLEFATPSNNALHGYLMGSHESCKGEKNPCSKYPEELIIRICERMTEPYKSYKELKEDLNIDVPSTLLQNISGKWTWNHISDNYLILRPDNTNKLTLSINEVIKICERAESPYKKYKDLLIDNNIIVTPKLVDSVRKIVNGVNHKKLSSRYNLLKLK